MIRYFYVPFEDPGLQTQSKGVKVPGTIVQRVYYSPNKKKQLQFLSRFSQLYIVGHGASGDDNIYDNVGKSLPIADIPKMLLAEGVSKSHRLFKLWACESADTGRSSSAYKLLAALRAAGFNKAVVAGYSHCITISSNGHKHSVEDVMHDFGDGAGPVAARADYGRASENRMYFKEL
jgi:hypothetical protein